jgi:hypothetical protein
MTTVPPIAALNDIDVVVTTTEKVKRLVLTLTPEQGRELRALLACVSNRAASQLEAIANGLDKVPGFRYWYDEVEAESEKFSGSIHYNNEGQ